MKASTLAGQNDTKDKQTNNGYGLTCILDTVHIKEIFIDNKLTLYKFVIVCSLYKQSCLGLILG